MNVRWKLSLALSLSAMLATSASAQTVENSDSSTGGETGAAAPEGGGGGGGRYPIAYAKRGMTLSKMTLVPDLHFNINQQKTGLTSQTGFGLELGAAFGIMDDLEVRAVVLPLTLSPAAGYGNLTLEGTYRFLKDPELGIRFTAFLPTATGAKFAFRAGVPLDLHLNPQLRIESGVFFAPIFLDTLAWGLEIPIAISYNINDPFYLQLELLPGIKSVGTTYFAMGYTIKAGYTIAKGAEPMLDIDAFFKVNDFIQTAGGDAVGFNNFVIGFGAKFYLFL